MYKKVLLFAAATMAATSANATVVTYTSQAAFLSALGGTVTTDTFTNTTPVAGVTFTSTAGSISGGVFNDRVQGSSPIATTTFNFAGGIKGFGATFDETPAGFGGGIDFSINGSQFVSNLSNANAGTFYGFISTTAFTSVLFTSPATETYNLDNLKFGTGAVPEPATWAMMLTGLGMVGYAMRKRNPRTTVSYN